MEVRLTYSGPLYATGNDSKLSKRADHKHELRMAFAPQLKRLWEVTPFLKTGERSGPSVRLLERSPNVESYKAPWLAKKHGAFGWGFVPLVTSSLDLWCGIDVLFLRPGKAGRVLSQGDLDGRLKTLLDALAIPDANQGYESRSAPKGPLYTLLEDDRLVSKVSVETDELLELGGGGTDENFVRLVMAVSIRPYEMTLANMQFG